MRFNWVVLGENYKRNRFEEGKEISFLEVEQEKARQLILQLDSTFVFQKEPHERFVLFERVFLSPGKGEIRVLVAGIEGLCYLFFLPNLVLFSKDKECPSVNEVALRMLSCQK